MKGLSEPLDPRKIFVRNKYSRFTNILAFASGKGGVGKSTLSGLFSMYLAQKGYKTGLLDLDLYGPSAHIILGASVEGLPEEENGVIPKEINGVHFMSVVFYSENRPLVMRGRDLGDAVLELLTITNWPELDWLIFDMPPGLGDTLLEVSELTPARYIVVTNSSRLSMESVEKLIEFIKTQNLEYYGLVENMVMNGGLKYIRDKSEEMGVPYLGTVGFYRDIEKLYGAPDALMSSPLKEDFDRLFKNILEGRK